MLLLFVGLFGFILFSFDRLQPGARFVVEIAIPVVLLGSAMFLRRRGAPVVATALGLPGGVLLPRRGGMDSTRRHRVRACRDHHRRLPIVLSRLDRRHVTPSAVPQRPPPTSCYLPVPLVNPVRPMLPARIRR